MKKLAAVLACVLCIFICIGDAAARAEEVKNFSYVYGVRNEKVEHSEGNLTNSGYELIIPFKQCATDFPEEKGEVVKEFFNFDDVDPHKFFLLGVREEGPYYAVVAGLTEEKKGLEAEIDCPEVDSLDTVVYFTRSKAKQDLVGRVLSESKYTVFVPSDKEYSFAKRKAGVRVTGKTKHVTIDFKEVSGDVSGNIGDKYEYPVGSEAENLYNVIGKCPDGICGVP